MVRMIVENDDIYTDPEQSNFEIYKVTLLRSSLLGSKTTLGDTHAVYLPRTARSQTFQRITP